VLPLVLLLGLLVSLPFLAADWLGISAHGLQYPNVATCARMHYAPILIAFGSILEHSVLLGLVGAFLRRTAHYMADSEPNIVKGIGYVLDAVGVTFLIVGGEIGLTAFAKGEAEHITVIGIIIFMAGLIFVGCGYFWVSIQNYFRASQSALLQIVIGALLLTWLFFGYDVYHQSYAQPQQPKVPTTPDAIIAQLNLMTSHWGNYQFEDIYNRPFSHETVKLDGRRFHNCTFDNVTFEFEGTGPFEFDPPVPAIIGDVKVRSDIPIVKGAFNVCLLGCRPITKSVENLPTIK